MFRTSINLIAKCNDNDISTTGGSNDILTIGSILGIVLAFTALTIAFILAGFLVGYKRSTL